MTIRVLVADDQALVRGSFRILVDTAPDLTTIGEAATGAEAVDLARREKPDVILMDIRMPGMDGLEATRRLVASGLTTTAGEPTRVIILTTFDLDEYVYAALRAGASGFLLKDVTPDHLVHAVRLVRDGDALLAPGITRRLIDRFASPPRVRQDFGGLPTLTTREREVLVLLARGMSNAELAAELRLGEATVKTHIGHVLMKLALRDRVQAVILAYDLGLVAPGGP